MSFFLSSNILLCLVVCFEFIKGTKLVPLVSLLNSKETSLFSIFCFLGYVWLGWFWGWWEKEKRKWVEGVFSWKKKKWGKKKWQDPTIFSPSPPKNDLSKLGWKYKRVCKAFVGRNCPWFSLANFNIFFSFFVFIFFAFFCPLLLFFLLLFFLSFLCVSIYIYNIY